MSHNPKTNYTLKSVLEDSDENSHAPPNWSDAVGMKHHCSSNKASAKRFFSLSFNRGNQLLVGLDGSSGVVRMKMLWHAFQRSGPPKSHKSSCRVKVFIGLNMNSVCHETIENQAIPFPNWLCFLIGNGLRKCRPVSPKGQLLAEGRWHLVRLHYWAVDMLDKPTTRYAMMDFRVERQRSTENCSETKVLRLPGARVGTVSVLQNLQCSVLGIKNYGIKFYEKVLSISKPTTGAHETFAIEKVAKRR